MAVYLGNKKVAGLNVLAPTTVKKLVDITLTEDTGDIKLDNLNMTPDKVYELYIAGHGTSINSIRLIYNDIEDTAYYNVFKYFNEPISGDGYNYTTAIEHYCTSHRTNGIRGGMYFAGTGSFTRCEIIVGPVGGRVYFNYESGSIYGCLGRGIGVHPNAPEVVNSITIKDMVFSAGTKIILFEKGE